MNRNMPGLPVHHQLLEFTQTHVHRVSDAIQLSHALSSPSPPLPNPSQHQSLFQWVNSSHEVAKVLEFHHFVINRWRNNGNSEGFYFWCGSKITVDGDGSHEIKTLAPWKKSYAQSRQNDKNQGHYFAKKVRLDKAMVLPVVMCECESWTINKAECWRVDGFELWFWRRLFRVP